MRALMTVSLFVAFAALAGCIDLPPTSGNPAPEVKREIKPASGSESERIVKLEDDLAQARAERDRLRRELAAAQKSTGMPQEFRFEVRKVEFGFLTAAVNFDNEGKAADRKFDNGIAAYVSLYDQFDSSLKAAGAFRFDLLDLSREKSFTIATWTFEPEAAARFWQRFPACYQFKLPLPNDLASRKVTLKVTFRQSGKPDLTATKEISIERP